MDIIQPDPSHAGGITETRKIAAMAEAMTWRWHCIARSARLRSRRTCNWMPSATTPSIQEQSLGIHYNQGNDLLDYLKDPRCSRYENGYVNIPDGPGLGIEIDESTCASAPPSATAGATRSGAIRMEASPNGDISPVAQSGYGQPSAMRLPLSNGVSL